MLVPETDVIMFSLSKLRMLVWYRTYRAILPWCILCYRSQFTLGVNLQHLTSCPRNAGLTLLWDSEGMDGPAKIPDYLVHPLPLIRETVCLARVT